MCARACVCEKKPVEQVDRRGWVGFCCHRYFQAHARCHLFPHERVPALQSTFEIRCAVTQSERIEIFPLSFSFGEVTIPALGQSIHAHFGKGTTTERGSYGREGRARKSGQMVGDATGTCSL